MKPRLLPTNDGVIEMLEDRSTIRINGTDADDPVELTGTGVARMQILATFTGNGGRTLIHGADHTIGAGGFVGSNVRVRNEGIFLADRADIPFQLRSSDPIINAGTIAPDPPATRWPWRWKQPARV